MPEDQSPWLKIKVRPVLIRNERKLQFSYFDKTKDITKNYSGAELNPKLEEVLKIPFGQINIQTNDGDIQIRISIKGKVSIIRNKPITSAHERNSDQAPNLTHNHQKSYPLNPNTPDPFLQTIGIMNQQGKVLASMQGKFIQINEFLRVIQQTVPHKSELLQIVDCGCGSAYLTFATYHYLNHIVKIPVHITGIDRNQEIINKCNQLKDALGWNNLDFLVSNIGEYIPQNSPDMVLSLHACDTATDQVIAKGILWQSAVILAAPCCQHELHHQLQASLFKPLLRHGILKERLADLLTDAFRALVLRIMGYNTSVIEFVAPENTAKNLLIRAEKGLPVGEPQFIKEYQELKAFWEVTPAIEQLLDGVLPVK